MVRRHSFRYVWNSAGLVSVTDESGSSMSSEQIDQILPAASTGVLGRGPETARELARIADIKNTVRSRQETQGTAASSLRARLVQFATLDEFAARRNQIERAFGPGKPVEGAAEYLGKREGVEIVARFDNSTSAISSVRMSRDDGVTIEISYKYQQVKADLFARVSTEVRATDPNAGTRYFQIAIESLAITGGK